jgi:putative MATE family efflux protein
MDHALADAKRPPAKPEGAAQLRASERLRRLLDGPIGPTLAQLAAPNIAVVAVQTAVVVSDLWFVSHLGTSALAALALVFPIQTMMGMMSAGAIGGGISSAIARSLGAGDRERAEAVLLHALLIALGMAALYSLLFGFGARPLFAAIGGKDETLEGAVAYARIVFGGALLIWLANTLASILRGIGNVAVPGLMMVLTSLGGIALSGALTLGRAGLPAIGVQGPALASVVSFGTSTLVMAIYMGSGRAGLRFRLWHVRLRAELFFDILRVGLVACGNALLTISTIVVVTSLVGRYGTAAIAGYGLGSRLELMLIPIAFGVGAALTAMVGTNRGAGQYARARRAAWVGGLFTFAVTGAVGITVGVAPDLWIALYTADPTAVEHARLYLHIAGPAYAFFGLGMALYFASQGTGNMLWPFVAGVARLVVAAGLGATLALGFGASLAWLFACVAAGLVLFGGIIALSLFGRVWRPR